MDLSVVTAFQAEVEKHIPGFRLAFKDETFSQRMLGKVVGVFNRGYMKTFTTTLGNTVYFPSREYFEASPDRAFTILAHEFVHLTDGKDKRVWFTLSYLFPQVLSVPLLSLGFVGLFWSAWALTSVILGLACLAPWPARWRSQWEARGYTMTLAVLKWTVGSISPFDCEWVASNFYGPNYYFMTWGKENARRLIASRATYAESNEVNLDAPYRIVRDFLQERGLLRVS